MQKQTIKAGFFEPGLIEASRFARFEPYQKTEFCLLAAEAGIAVPSIAEMLRVNTDDVQSAMERRHLHNPFRSIGISGKPVEESVSVGRRNRLAVLSYIGAGRASTVTISLVDLSRATGVRRGSLDGAMKRLREKGQIEILRKGDKGKPSTYRLTEKGAAALEKLRESA